MRIVPLCLALGVFLAGTAAAAGSFEYGVLEGEWGAYQTNLIKADWYNYLKITEGSGGAFAYSYGPEPQILRFTEKDIKREDGFLVITLRCCNGAPMRLVISAFRTSNGAALLTGSLFMFQEQDANETLYNTIPVRMTPLAGDAELSSKLQTVRNLVAK